MSDNASLNPASPQRRVAVVVVHGVGDAVPAEALNELVDHLEANYKEQFTAERQSEVYHLTSSTTIGGEPADVFPVHTRNATLTATGDKVRFYDFHWADLTRTLPGRLNAFLGCFRIIFEVHHFIDALLPKESRGSAKLLRGLLLLAAYILRGPIVGLSIFIVAIGLAYYFGWSYFPLLLGEDPQRLRMMWAIIGLLVVVACIATFLFYYRGGFKKREWDDALVTVIYCSLILAGYIVYTNYPLLTNDAPGGAAFERCEYINRIYVVIQSCRVLWCWLLLLALPIVAWLYLSSWFKRRSVRPSAGMAAVSVVVLQSALWLSLISAFAVPFIKEAALYHELAVFKHEANRIETCHLEDLYVSAATTFVVLILVGSFGAITYLARVFVSRLPLVSLQWRATLTPRMLLGRGITFAILLGLFVQVSFFSASFINAVERLSRHVTLVQVQQQLEKSESALEGAKDKSKAYSEGLYPLGAALVLLVSALIGVGFTTGIHIARDLIDHQYSPRRGFARYLLPMRLADGPDKPRRARVAGRLETLARELICKDGFHDLVFIVHSQGSVIAYDFLRGGGRQCEELLCARPHLITMGSPLGHLYRFYFKEYAELDAEIASLRPRLGSWTNLYRADDYVGRNIGGPSDGFIQNCVMPPGGHRDYWHERVVSDVIFDRLSAPTSTGA